MALAKQAVSAPRGDRYPLRLLATLASFVLFGLGGLCLRLFVFPLLNRLPQGSSAQCHRARRTINSLFRSFIRFMASSGVLTFDVQGQERLGRPGQMVIANHPSLLDVVFLISLIREANCVVKQSLWRNPFTRGPVRSAQYISNDGSLDMLDTAVAALQAGQTLIVFPEGTRTTPGQAPVLHRGAAAIALRGARVITPVTIKVSPTTLTKAEPWYRIPHRRVRFSFQVGADIDPEAFNSLGPAPRASRLLNEHLHQYFMKELHLDERTTP